MSRKSLAIEEYQWQVKFKGSSPNEKIHYHKTKHSADRDAKTLKERGA